MATQAIETDYLIVGSGAVGMAFADVLIKESDARVLFVDRHHGPGGHWNDAYSFVKLHQPSNYYGVNSRKLGDEALDATGINVGMFERATGAQLVAYYEQVMQGFLASGRVQYFPMCNYTGDYAERHEFTSLMSGETQTVVVHKKIIDTTYLNTAVPSTHPPKYAIAPGVKCVPLNELPRVKAPPTGYVVVGSGKTGIDACLWLLENAVSPDAITWIMPRDAWYFNRANVQPSMDFFVKAYGAMADGLEAVALAESQADLFARLSAAGVLLRLDANVQPTMFHGAIMSQSEVEALGQIKNIVRLGRIQRIEEHQIVLQHGSVAVDPQRLYVDCSASAAQIRPSIAVFDGKKITPQFVRTVQPTFSAALIAHIELCYADDVQKNQLTTPVPLPDQPIDWLKMLAVSMANQQRWSKDKEILKWIGQSRLDGFSAMARSVQPTDTEKVAQLQRFAKNAGPAMAKVPQLLAEA
jgi:hypothetical protein